MDLKVLGTACGLSILAFANAATAQTPAATEKCIRADKYPAPLSGRNLIINPRNGRDFEHIYGSKMKGNGIFTVLREFTDANTPSHKSVTFKNSRGDIARGAAARFLVCPALTS
jgi:hypothetical protein